ncbi:response regulator [Candidatus Nitrospira bockiana]
MAPLVEDAKPTILLVDDHPSLRLILSAGLRAQGFEVLTAATAEKALALAESFEGRIDLLCSDVGLTPPEVSAEATGAADLAQGIRLAEQVLATRPGIKVALLTGYSDERLAQSGALATPFVLIRKPCDLPTLVRAFHQLLAPAAGKGGE